jgi:hypothetical protein
VLPLTERARHSLKVAHDFAAAAGAEYVDTGYVFLAVLAENGACGACVVESWT